MTTDPYPVLFGGAEGYNVLWGDGTATTTLPWNKLEVLPVNYSF